MTPIFAPTTRERRTLGALAAEARRTLEQAGVPNPAQETRWLMEYALNLKSHQLVSGADQPLSDDAWDRAERVFARRTSREPLQYILGTQEFCGLEFSVSSDVLIPRAETELLVREVVRRVALEKGSTVVEVGTGSGCIAVALATVLQAIRIIAVDRSIQALTAAKNNAVKHAVDRNIEWLEGDLLTPIAGRGLDGDVDVIVSNPPYIAEADWDGLQPEVRLFEPREALVAGVSGTEMHERLLREAKPFLAPAGLLLMEIGQGQAKVIRRLAEDVGGYAPLHCILDTTGIDRVVVLQRVG